MRTCRAAGCSAPPHEASVNPQPSKRKKSLLKGSPAGRALPEASLVPTSPRVPGGQEDGPMPEHVQVNMLGPCDVRARLRLSHWGTPAIEGVGPGRCLAPTAHRTPPETTRASVCRAGVGDLLSFRKRQPACGGSEAQGKRQGRAPDRGPQPSPAAQSGPVLTPAYPLLRAGGGTGHGAPGTAGHPGGGDEQEEAQATGHQGRPGTRRGGGDAGPAPPPQTLGQH